MALERNSRRTSSFTFVRKIPLERVSVFAGNLATCLSAGIAIPKALRTGARTFSRGDLKDLIEDAADRVEAGMEFAEALEPIEPRLPAYFLPVVRCGEQSGLLDEALRYLERHCAMLAEPARKLRNTWLCPLVIFVIGWVVGLIARLFFASPIDFLGFLVRSVFTYGGIVILLLFVYSTPQGRVFLDRIKLSIPLFGPVERDTAINRFFHVLNLLYSTGGMRVEAMIELAAATVANSVVRRDLLRSAEVIEKGGSISDAFAKPEMVADEHKAIIQVGEESGSLEAAFDTVSRVTAEAVDWRLTVFKQLFYRLFMPPIVLSIVITLASLVRTLMSG
jgi:type IV pilus assembly protein PilC